MCVRVFGWSLEKCLSSGTLATHCRDTTLRYCWFWTSAWRRCWIRGRATPPFTGPLIANDAATVLCGLDGDTLCDALPRRNMPLIAECVTWGFAWYADALQRRPPFTVSTNDFKWTPEYINLKIICVRGVIYSSLYGKIWRLCTLLPSCDHMSPFCIYKQNIALRTWLHKNTHFNTKPKVYS